VQDIRFVILTFLGFAIGVYTDQICALCGQSHESSESVQSWCEWIEQSADGMLSSSGTGVLRQLKRLPCKRCLAQMVAGSVSI
jgi:hypothetical protein